MVEVIRVHSQLVAGLRKRVKHAELGEFFGMAVNTAATAGALVSGPVTAVYYEDASESFGTTIGFPVSGALRDSRRRVSRVGGRARPPGTSPHALLGALPHRPRR